MASLASLIYDSAQPPLDSNTVAFYKVLTTDSVFWTSFRTGSTWASFGLRMAGVIELVARLFTESDYMAWLMNPIEIIDALLVLTMPPLRFFLLAKYSLTYNLLILLRYIRLYSFFVQVKKNFTHEAEKEILKTERECQHIMSHLKRLKEQAEQELETAQSKLRVLTG